MRERIPRRVIAFDWLGRECLLVNKRTRVAYRFKQTVRGVMLVNGSAPSSSRDQGSVEVKPLAGISETLRRLVAIHGTRLPTGALGAEWVPVKR